MPSGHTRSREYLRSSATGIGIPVIVSQGLETQLSGCDRKGPRRNVLGERVQRRHRVKLEAHKRLSVLELRLEGLARVGALSLRRVVLIRVRGFLK